MLIISRQCTTCSILFGVKLPLYIRKLGQKKCGLESIHTSVWWRTDKDHLRQLFYSWAPSRCSLTMVVSQINIKKSHFISWILLIISTGDEILPGNNGMLDQVEALKWVQKNIKGKSVWCRKRLFLWRGFPAYVNRVLQFRRKLPVESRYGPQKCRLNSLTDHRSLVNHRSLPQWRKDKKK